MNKMSLAFAIGLTCLGGCASTGERGALENYNRAVFGFNEGVDKAVLAPTAKTYEKIIPKPIRAGTSNFLSNIGEPVNFANKILQGDVNGAADVTGRFLMNSTIGLLGFVDVASMDGIPKHSEDFGQTMAVWGIPSGPFVILPLLGPSTLRDSLARPVDSALSPINYADLDAAYYGVTNTVGLLNTRIAIDPALEAARQQLDPYTAQKRGYQIFRESLINNGKRPDDVYDSLPDFDDFG